MELRRLLPLVVALLFSGCVLGPNYMAPKLESTPATFLTAPEKPAVLNPTESWWRSLGDEQLNVLVERALQGNLDIQIADSRIREARAVRSGIAGASLPTLAAGGRVARDSVSRNGEQFSFIPASVPNTFSSFRAGFDASWELDFFGRIRRGAEAADARLESTVDQHEFVALSIAAEVASRYIEYRVFQQRQVLLERNIAIEEDTLRLVRVQSAAGTISELEVARAEGEWHQSRANLPTLQAGARETLHSLSVLTGRPPASLVAELAAVTNIPVTPAAVPLDLPSNVIRRRPDLRAAERELAAATAEIGIAVANQFPTFSLSAALGLDSIHSGSFADAASRYWSLGPSVGVPLFQGGRLKSEVERRRSVCDQALLAYRQAVLGALSDVETALVRVDRERARLAELDAGCTAIERAVALAKDRFRAGDTAFSDVLDVERQLNQVTDTRARSRGDLAQDFVSLQKALGGGFQP